MQWEVLWFAQNSLPLRWQRQHKVIINIFRTSCDLLKIHYLCGDKDNTDLPKESILCVVICSKFITFAVTKTTELSKDGELMVLWFAQNSLPLRWQRQPVVERKRLRFSLWFAQNSLPLRWQRPPRRMVCRVQECCDLLKIHYLCGDKDNTDGPVPALILVVICSKFITFAVTKTTRTTSNTFSGGCDLLKIHYLCGDKDNAITKCNGCSVLWFAQNSLPLRWQRQQVGLGIAERRSCDLLKIHYLCGDKDNGSINVTYLYMVVICSKFITFAVTKTTNVTINVTYLCCDLLKIHYLCGDKDNIIDCFM